MSPLWIGILLGSSVIAILVLTSWRRRIDMTERGTVSQAWLAEHRANHQRER